MTRKQPGDMTREERPELDERPGQGQGFGERGDELQESAACRKKGRETNRGRGAGGGGPVSAAQPEGWYATWAAEPLNTTGSWRGTSPGTRLHTLVWTPASSKNAARPLARAELLVNRSFEGWQCALSWSLGKTLEWRPFPFDPSCAQELPHLPSVFVTGNGGNWVNRPQMRLSFRTSVRNTEKGWSCFLRYISPNPKGEDCIVQNSRREKKTKSFWGVFLPHQSPSKRHQKSRADGT